MAGTYITEEDIKSQEPNTSAPGNYGTFIGHIPHCFEDRDPAKYKECKHGSMNTQGNKNGPESVDDSIQGTKKGMK